ncbi:alpha/beta hydrolase [Mycobacterium sp. 1274761.0]|nr:alpha/beta hydrolase [Mycobacterium sp. 1274761.0]
MSAILPTQRVDFRSDGTRCAAWLTLPAGAGPHPAIALVHGFGATHDMMLSQYELYFAGAGIATLAFDYRNTGASDGQPRQRISLRQQRSDVEAALDFLARRPHIDSNRIGLWGTSLGGMNVLRVAATRNDVAAVVVQCPIVHGPAAALKLGLVPALRLVPLIVDDAVRASLRRRRRYVPIVGPPGSTAAVTIAGAEAGWRSTVPPDAWFDNRVAAADTVELVWTSSLRQSRTITAPLLVCVSERETLIAPKYVELVAQRAPLGEVRRYDADHFDVYHPPLVHEVLADQTAFLKEHLHVGS